MYQRAALYFFLQLMSVYSVQHQPSPTPAMPTCSNKAPKHCPKSTTWTEKHHEFQGFPKPQNNSAVSSRENNIMCFTISGQALPSQPHTSKTLNYKTLSLTATLWPSQFQTKSFGCASCEVTFLTGRPWNCKSPSFLSKKGKKREGVHASPMWQKHIPSQARNSPRQSGHMKRNHAYYFWNDFSN